MKTSDAAAIELERRIAARPETVFSYFTDPERFRLWHGVDAELEPRPGGRFRITQTERSGFVARGVYVTVEPPKRLVFTWGWEDNDALPDGMRGLPPGASTVEVLLIPDGDATILRLRHTGLPTRAFREVHGAGWQTTLDRLVVTAEGGDPGPYPFGNL